MLRLRAQITIDIEATDFVAAADHQRQVEGFIDAIREVYSGADLAFRERRTPAGPRDADPAPRRKATGRLNSYVDPAAEEDRTLLTVL
jgi:hypothetical protein